MTFISIPKVASTSIRKALGITRNNHKSSHKVKEGGFRFCFVRNPYDRLVSWYEWHRKNEPQWAQYQMSFKDWIIDGCPHHWDFILCDSQGISSPLNQWEFVKGGVDFIGKYETLDIDFKNVCFILGVDPKLPHELRSNKKQWQSYYDQDTMELVRIKFKRDFIQFGYGEV